MIQSHVRVRGNAVPELGAERVIYGIDVGAGVLLAARKGPWRADPELCERADSWWEPAATADVLRVQGYRI